MTGQVPPALTGRYLPFERSWSTLAGQYLPFERVWGALAGRYLPLWRIPAARYGLNSDFLQ